MTTLTVIAAVVIVIAAVVLLAVVLTALFHKEPSDNGLKYTEFQNRTVYGQGGKRTF